MHLSTSTEKKKILTTFLVHDTGKHETDIKIFNTNIEI